MSGCSGNAEAIGHAGEVLQGVIDGECFLVTLPAPGLRSIATAVQAASWSIDPPSKTKALRAAKLAAPGPLRLRIDTAIPIGRGYGSSTADCSAAVRAVANHLDAEQIAAILHEAEAASDSTMFGEEPVVFLPRQGRVLRRLRGHWPHTHVTVIDLGGEAVDTLETPLPGYTARDCLDFARLLATLEAAFAEGDLKQIAEVATRSAWIHQAHRPHPRWEAVYEDLMAAGALGVARAHSGTLAAALSHSALPIPADYRYELGGL